MACTAAQSAASLSAPLGRTWSGADLGLALQQVEGKEGKKGKAKKEKKYKDPNAPKRPASAYLEFQNAVRKQFRDADPGLPYAEVLRKISDTWAHMDPKDKEVSRWLAGRHSSAFGRVARIGRSVLTYLTTPQHWNEITAAKTAEYEVAKAAYTPVDADGNELPAVTPKGKKSAEVHIGKDGKEYTGKKRGRKSNAEKLALAAEEAGGEGVLDQIAQAVDAAPKKEKKATKAKVRLLYRCLPTVKADPFTSLARYDRPLRPLLSPRAPRRSSSPPPPT